MSLSDPTAESIEIPVAITNESQDELGKTKQASYNGPLKLPEDKNSITIVMVGETGCGKTAFMSLLQNLFQGCGALELEDLHNKTTDSNLKKSCSQTEKAKLYELKTPGGEFTIRMLDTPGLGDLRGLEQDKVNQKEITNAISQLGTIDAVVIMSNGTTERLGPVTAYALQTLVTIFPRDILENIGFIYTHTRPLLFNFQPDSLPPELKKSPYWLVENPLALIVKHNAMAQNKTRTSKIIQKSVKEIHGVYDDTIKTLDEWLEWINACPLQPTKGIQELYNKFIQVQSRLDNLVRRLEKLSTEEKEWKKIQEKLKSAQNNKQTMTELQQLAGPRYSWTKEETPDQGNTICMREDCHNNCHLGCGDNHDGGWVCNPGRMVCGQFYITRRYAGLFFFSPTRWLQSYTGTCKSCGHSVDEHMLHQYKHTQVRVEMDPELGQKINAAETKAEKLAVADTHVSRNLGIIKGQVAENLEQIGKLVAEIQGISLSPDFSAYINSTIDLLERRANSDSISETESARKIHDSIRTLRSYLKILKPSPLYGIMGKDSSREGEKWERIS